MLLLLSGAGENGTVPACPQSDRQTQATANTILTHCGSSRQGADVHPFLPMLRLFGDVWRYFWMSGGATTGILWVKSARTKSVSNHPLDIIWPKDASSQCHFWQNHLQGNPCWPSCSLVCLRGSLHTCKVQRDLVNHRRRAKGSL